MDTRKLQQVGGGTFTVSIPKEWATDHALEAGAEVHLYTHADGSVVVRSAERDGGRLDAVSVELARASDDDDAEAATASDGPAEAATASDGPAEAATASDGSAETLRVNGGAAPADAGARADTDDAARVADVTRTLRAAQTAGFETVRLTHPDAFSDGQRRAARTLASDLVGTDVVTERADELAVRNLLDASDVSVRQSVVQLQFVACSVHRAGTTAFLDADDDAAERLRDRRDEAERLFGMVARHCNRALASLATVDRLGVSRPQLFDYYETARHLRDVAAEGVRIAAVAQRLSRPPAAPVAGAVERVGAAGRSVVEDAASVVLEGSDVPAAHAALDAREEVAAEADALETALFVATDAAECSTAGSAEGSIADSTTDLADCPDADGPSLSAVDAAERLALARALDPLSRTADHGAAVARVALRSAIREEGAVAGTSPAE